ncbi:MAG: MBL fold metallo-hydrolase [Gemmataceae bacterium]
MSGFALAASVVLARPADDAVYLVHRSASLRFMGGFVAFPGGKVDPADGGPAGCAARELFEEAGVLLGAPPGDHSALRRALLAGAGAFPAAPVGLLAPAGKLITPAFSPVRFDTSFFVALLPPGQDAEVWPGELEAGAWWRIDDALAAWRAGELLLSPPTYSILEVLRGRPAGQWAAALHAALDAIQARRIAPIWFSPGVRMIPLDSPGLPPMRYTNAFLVGTGPRVLIDPGPTDVAEQDALLEDLAGVGLDGVILTHHHPDHVGAARRVSEELGVPVWAHVDAAARMPHVPIDRFLDDGTVLGLGDLQLHAILTPGHAPGHLAFWEPTHRLLFAADLVSPLSSVIVDPEDGDLTDYLASVHRVKDLPARLLLPAHGPPTTRAGQLFARTLEHRAAREEQLLAALAAGRRDLRELALELYRGSPEETLRLAERQIESGLIKLRREGRA